MLYSKCSESWMFLRKNQVTYNLIIYVLDRSQHWTQTLQVIRLTLTAICTHQYLQLCATLLPRNSSSFTYLKVKQLEIIKCLLL